MNFRQYSSHLPASQPISFNSARVYHVGELNSAVPLSFTLYQHEHSLRADSFSENVRALFANLGKKLGWN